ncbi:hypothetical protein GH714_018138 [Hevea brasiliensis]|uniref:Clp R domain-containing protein n=1 Tax=Hevea brasiliensis TaxID=3981 RepID=A0A6A6MXW4_HEVBR|nr:hypothetical protein GH714_018138 [Hevea brasiliensis]
MRSGACTVQQTLTTEAASVLKHSLSLARRRGHAQVTPLHVAATLLSSRASLLRRACLKSRPHQSSHPLQCRALELCFNVALNRLPTTPGPLLHGQPSLSNALIAALKRAQAHQRRGCIEQQQQQPLLTIKVELEQLIISILDDPSVSRVMREAGFSSTAVKNNIEDSSASSVFQCYTTTGGGVFSSPCSPSPGETQREIINPTTFWQTHFLTYSSEKNPLLFSPQKKLSSNYFTESNSVKEDIKLVLEVFLRKKRKNTVIVVSLRFMKKEDVEMNISQLKRRVDSAGEGGAIIYTGDLKWTVEESLINGEDSAAAGYRPADHLVAELGRLLSDYSSSNTKVWLMATASYQTYMRCQMRLPPLEIQWSLQAVSVPSGGLGLSLHGSSINESRVTFSQNPSQLLETKPFIANGKDEEDKLTCCAECTSSYEKEAQLFKPGQQKNLPSWLHPQGTNANQKDELAELRRKWNRFCQGLHQQGRHIQSHLGSTTLYNDNQCLIGKSHSYASSYPWWPSQNNIFSDSNSISFRDSVLKPNQTSNFVPKFRRQQSCTIDFNFGSETQKHMPGEPNLDSLKNSQGREVKITLELGNSFCTDIGGRDKERSDLCKLLQENVPWQSDTIHSIVEALIESKSTGKGTLLLIQGNDALGKRRLALAIAESVLGSVDFLLCMNMRKKDNEATYSETIEKTLRNQEKIVALVEDVDFADMQFMKLLANGFETGKFGESGNISQAIFILATGGHFMSYEDGKMDQDSVIRMTLEVEEKTPTNKDHKRKAEWDISSKTKSPRISENKEIENGNVKKDFSRQSSFNTLDLNIKANEDDESEEKQGEFSPISSDLTRETSSDPVTSTGFLDMIKNRYVFNRNQAQDREMAEVFSSKIKRCMGEVFGEQNVNGFSIEERILEEVLEGYGSFVNSLLERWLKDIFQKTLQRVKIGGKEGVGIRLCFEGRVLEDGFMVHVYPTKSKFPSWTNSSFISSFVKYITTTISFV